MAHSAVVIDQFVVVFGGLNRITNGLISNDLYVLCLNGNANALLPKEKVVDEKKRPRLNSAKAFSGVGKSPTTSESFANPAPITFEQAFPNNTDTAQSVMSVDENNASSQK